MSDREPKRGGNPTEGYLCTTREMLLQQPKIIWEYGEHLQRLHFQVGQQTRNRDTFLARRGNLEDEIGPFYRPTSQAAFNTSTGFLEDLLIFDARKPQPLDEAQFRFFVNNVGEKAARRTMRDEQEERIPKTEILIKDLLGEKAAALFHYMFTTDDEVSSDRVINLTREEMEALTQIWPQKYAELRQTQQSFETKLRSIPGAVWAEEDPRANIQSPHHLFPE